MRIAKDKPEVPVTIPAPKPNVTPLPSRPQPAPKVEPVTKPERKRAA